MGVRAWAFLGGFLLAAAVLAYLAGVFVAERAEARLDAAFAAALAAAGADWARGKADGFQLLLTGEAPDAGARDAVLALAGRVAGPGRVEDRTTLRPAPEPAAEPMAEGGPLITLTRDGEVLTLAGTLPPGIDRAAVAAGLPPGLRLDGDVAATEAGPEAGEWRALFDLALATALALDRAQVAVGPCHIAVTGVARDAGARAAATDGLRAAGHCLARAEILTERPLLSPFPFALRLGPGGGVLEACAAASAEEAARIVAALEAAGLAGTTCPEALGVPSAEWGVAVLAAISALREAGAGRVTIRGTLVGFEPAEAGAAGPARERLAAALPRDFALAPAAPVAPSPAPVPDAAALAAEPGFGAWLARDRSLYLTGLPAAPAEAEAVRSFAAALFGSDRVTVAPDAPRMAEAAGLTARTLAGLSALAVLEEGRLSVTAERIAIEGRSIAADAEARARALLSGEAGEVAVAVTFDAAAAAETPPETPEACLAAAERALAEGRIVFAPGSATIEAASRATLERLAGLMRRCTGARFEIGGHTDNQGEAEANLLLSETRAEAVLLALAELGVPLERLTAKGYGEADPVADNATEAGREANRRIGFRLAEEALDARE